VKRQWHYSGSIVYPYLMCRRFVILVIEIAVVVITFTVCINQNVTLSSFMLL
jgi:hypothetical protein